MNILSHSGPFALFFAFAIAHALAAFALRGPVRDLQHPAARDVALLRDAAE